MKLALRVVAIAGLAALVFWFWTTILFPSPEKVVLKKVARLAADANIASGDGMISRAAKASDLVDQFDVNAEIVIDVSGVGQHTFSSRDEISQAALTAFSRLASLKTEFLDARAHVEPDKETAEVTCTARVSMDNNRDSGIQELRFQLKKVENDWKITRAETVKTLQ